jgi:two-component system LytT family response regulator
VRINKRIKLLNVDEISRIVSEHRLINVYDRAGKRYWTNETLDQLNKRLDPSIFMRIHRSSLVNLQAGIEVEPWDDGRLKIHFLDGEVLIAAREPAKELRERLGL